MPIHQFTSIEFTAVHESGCGTKRQLLRRGDMSGVGSKGEDICSQRVFRSLTQTGSRGRTACSSTYGHNLT
jgi:hypothetical protein